MQHVPGLLLVSSYFFLKLCGAQDIVCTVTQDGGRTRYSVPEFTAKDCHYNWLNNTNHVLANQVDPPDDQVLEQSNRTLLTSKCSELIHYSRSCTSEGVKREANCTTICSGNAGLQNGGEIPTEIPENNWIVPTVATIVVLVLVVLVVVLVVVLYCKCRDNIRSCCRRITNPSTSETTEYEMTDVEEQHG